MKDKNLRKAMLSNGAHSLFLSGDNNEKIALGVVKDLLCMKPNDDDKSCGECKSCDMIEAFSHPDLLVLGDGETTIKVGEIREACEWVGMRPTYTSRVIAIINAQNMTEQAQNALLRTLEEPPESVYFVLSGDERRLLRTIRSRITLWIDAQSEKLFDQELLKTAMQSNKHIEKKDWIKLNQIYLDCENIGALLDYQIIELRDSALSEFGIKRIVESESISKNRYHIDLFKSEKIIALLLNATKDLDKSINKNLAIDALVVEISRL